MAYDDGDIESLNLSKTKWRLDKGGPGPAAGAAAAGVSAGAAAGGGPPKVAAGIIPGAAAVAGLAPGAALLQGPRGLVPAAALGGAPAGAAAVARGPGVGVLGGGMGVGGPAGAVPAPHPQALVGQVIRVWDPERNDWATADVVVSAWWCLGVALAFCLCACFVGGAAIRCCWQSHNVSCLLPPVCTFSPNLPPVAVCLCPCLCATCVCAHACLRLSALTVLQLLQPSAPGQLCGWPGAAPPQPG